jgi:zinc transport system permease protein
VLSASWLPLASAPDNTNWLHEAINAFTRWFPPDSFFAQSYNVRALLALVLVAICCGSVGSVVVGSRMAFFSDALAHCAFAGVSIGFILFDLLLSRWRPASEFWQWVTPVMLIFGVLIGFGIVWVRQHTGLASDTAIGVFFASCLGLTALLHQLITSREYKFNLEEFLFGNPLWASANDLLALFALTVLTVVLLILIYNPLQLGSFNSSLALARRVSLNLHSYLFVMLLALIVNLCLRSVGALLINALLVVPAATAANLSKNLRQMFRLTFVLCVGTCLTGLALNWEIEARFRVPVGLSGTIVLLSVVIFFVSVTAGPVLRRWRDRQNPLPPTLAADAPVQAGREPLPGTEARE